jgi:hypothetical protein
MASQQPTQDTRSQGRAQARVQERQVAGPSQLRANMGRKAASSSDYTRHEPLTIA